MRRADKSTVWLVSLFVALIPIGLYLLIDSIIPPLGSDWWRFWDETTATSTEMGEVRTVSLSGRVVLGPICPVERIPPDPLCAPRPYETTVELRRSGESSVVTTTRTGRDGSFRFNVSADLYEMHVHDKEPFPSCPTVVIEVKGAMAPVEILCDTGIR